MRQVLSVSYGELILKGKNRQTFIKEQETAIHRALRGIPIEESFYQFGKYFLVVDPAQQAEAIRRLQRVFGLVFITPSWQVAKEESLDAASQACLQALEDRLVDFQSQPGHGKVPSGHGQSPAGLTTSPAASQVAPGAGPSFQPLPSFKVKAKRADKSFPIPSPAIGAKLGARLLEAHPELPVDLKDPDILIQVEIREDIFVSCRRYPGAGGLPAGSGGRGLLLLSGGIDSPVAGYAMARRGMGLGAMHFHAYPYTSERAQDKAYRLAQQMSQTVGPMRVFMINLLDTYKAATLNCKPRNMTLLSRRMMMRIGSRLCDQYGYQAMITGESLGQVASQTVQGLEVVDNAASHLVLRPLIAQDKTQIIETARDLGTYPISIEPYDDCCSIFAPDRPNIKPRLSDIEEDEKNLPIEELLEAALATVKILEID